MSNAAVDFDPAGWPVKATDPTEEQEREAYLSALAEEAGANYEDPTRVEADVYLDHLFEKIKEAEAEIAANNEIAERRILMVEGWRAQQNRTPERRIGWLKHLIATIAEDYAFPRGKKSRELPNGAFGFRRSPDRLEILDMEKAVRFAEAHGMEIKKTVGKVPLKKYAQETGVVPPGTELVDGSDEFFLKLQ